jgi:hypothetical protein
MCHIFNLFISIKTVFPVRLKRLLSFAMYCVAGYETCIALEIHLHGLWMYKVKHVGKLLYGVRKCISFPSFCYHTKYFHYMVSRIVQVSRHVTIYLMYVNRPKCDINGLNLVHGKACVADFIFFFSFHL